MPQKNTLVTVKASQAKIKKWWDRVKLAQEERKRHEDDWDMLIEAYKPSIKKSGLPEDIKTNIIFRVTEQKKAALFFKTPEMRLLPTEMAKSPFQSGEVDPQTGQPQTLTRDPAVVVHEQVLNHHMDQKINLPMLMSQVLTDCLCPAGMMVSKIGYRPFIKMVEQPILVPATDEETGQALLDPETGEQPEVPLIDEKGRPATEEVPVLVKEEYFWHRVSPKRVLIPADFHSTDYEKAPWLGVEFEIPLRDAKRIYNLPKDFKPSKRSEERLLGKNRKQDESREDMVSGVELFYRANLEFDEVVHPDVLYQLVLIENHRENNVPVAAVHRMSPFQEINQETQQLTTDSMTGFPVHIGTLRDLPDSAYVPSDCAMIHAQVKEVDTYRRQNIKLRDANLTKFAYDTEKVTPDALNEIKSGDVGQYIAFQGGSLQGGIDKVIGPLSKASGSRVDVQSAFIIEQDIDKALSMGANQQGVETDTTRTATELSLIQSNSNVRLEFEQGRVLRYVIEGIRKYDALLQRFHDDDETIAIAGEAGVQQLQTWNKDVIAGRFLYDIKPDSQLRLDAATERQLWMQYYNLTAMDPFNNRMESLKHLQRLFGVDPSKAIQQPPEEKPKPSVGITFRGEDLIGPAAPMVLEILEQGGLPVSDENKQLAAVNAIRAQADAITQPEHGGPAERIQAVDKSQGDHTGSLPGPDVGAQS